MTAEALPNPEVQDALLELINIGVGRAAASISELTGCPVAINVPTLEILGLDHPRQLTDLQQGITMRVSQSFAGGLTGHTMFILNEEGAHRLAELLLHAPRSQQALDENEQAALLEVGNIIIGGVIGNLVNHIEVEVTYDLPQLQLRGVSGFVDLVSDLMDLRQARVLLMQASLSIAAENVNGYFMLLFDEPRLRELVARLVRMVSFP